ncbi:MAG: glycosyltransferase family 4 protein [Ignavibacteria bacterium]|nr:glycosyltransferase family 4 protein [Bacteroidota bacterium]MBL7128894.1 glycosyltransferase family 4 protein [Ignavibacteria bacterium]
MKVVHINISDIDGGASIACTRINNALSKAGVDSEILVQKKLGSYKHVTSIVENRFKKFSYLFRSTLDELYIRALTVQSRGRFSYPHIGTDISHHPLIKNADIINLHWINNGFISLKSIKKIGALGKPIVWTLHDMWPYTGGCHYTVDCEKFIKHCESCPSLKFSGRNDASKKIFDSKQSVYKDVNLTIVTTSNWLAKESKRSFLFKDKRIELIPNPIEEDIFKPVSKELVRKKLNLPMDKFLIFFGSMTVKDERKGFKFLKETLQMLSSRVPEADKKFELIVCGSAPESLLSGISLNVNHFGRFKDVRDLVFYYNAADIFVAPSLQDNLPNSVMESLSCGTPVLAFNIGGMPDMIDHKKNGYLSVPRSASSLCDGILWIFKDRNRRLQLSIEARNKVQNSFGFDIIGRKYLQLYNSLM